MKHLILLGFFFSLAVFKAKAQLPPKLVVYISVDQMRADYLFRFKKLFTTTGLLRMESAGSVYRSHHYRYVPTYTGPGHATLTTGTWPRYHGIVANDWYDRRLGRTVYCVEDSNAQSIGAQSKAGKMSPHFLLASTLGDELKMAYPTSKSVAIALKDRAAILMAGHKADGVFWFDDASGNFITSSFYATELPAWVHQFNQLQRAKTLLQEDWTLGIPEAMWVDFGPDSSPWEVPFKGTNSVEFPYPLKKLSEKQGLGLVKSVPAGNTITFEMAKAAIEGEHMGDDYASDLLHLSFSATDYCGHQFGSRSLELADMYQKFDQELTRFLTYLDQKVGEGEYLVVLTSDHGVAENPNALKAENIPGGEMPADFKDRLREWCAQQGSEEVLLAFENLQIYLDWAALEAAAVPKDEFLKRLEKWLESQPWVQEAIAAKDMDVHLDSWQPAGFAARGYGKNRSGDLFVLVAPGFVESSYGGKGATHGTHHGYDTHVPLLMFGKGASQANFFQATSVVDVAPTLAGILNLCAPNASIGKVLPGWERN